MNALEMDCGIMKTGYRFIDELLLGNSIVTIRCSDEHWLFNLVANLLVRNFDPSKRILYLHWVDYHKRFWSFDYDYLLRLAKENQLDTASLSEGVRFLRAFSRDNNEVRENWEKLFSLSGFNLIILDSISELYEDKKEDSLPMTYAIGKFVQLCIRNDCAGIILDRSNRRIHPYLAHVSSIIIEFDSIGHEILLNLIKHPCMPDVRDYIPRNRQYSLRRWM